MSWFIRTSTHNDIVSDLESRIDDLQEEVEGLAAYCEFVERMAFTNLDSYFKSDEKVEVVAEPKRKRGRPRKAVAA